MSKVFGAAVAATIPAPGIDWVKVEKRQGGRLMGCVNRQAFEAYQAMGGTLSPVQSLKAYILYSEEDWGLATQYWGGAEPYGVGWAPSESYSEWLGMELKGEEHATY